MTLIRLSACLTPRVLQMRPDVTAKRYSRGTQELVEIDSMNS